MTLSYAVGKERTAAFVSVYRVYPVSINNISCGYVKCSVLYKRGRVTIDYLWVILVGHGLKRRHRRIIR
jgi:hypothetical protein